jgi:predicted enzyme related to lactoylglutathione lyase
MSDQQKKRVTGIGGIFMKSNDPEYMRNWYNKHLGFNATQYGATFEWLKTDKPEEKGMTVWNPFKNTTDYFMPSEKEFMINLRVEDLEWLLVELRKEGIEQIGEMQVYDYGKFAHIIDPEGTKIELWEAVDGIL